MVDPCLTFAIKLVDEALDMPPAEAVQYLFDRYRVALPESKEAMVLALIGALNVARRGCRKTLPSHQHYRGEA